MKEVSHLVCESRGLQIRATGEKRRTFRVGGKSDVFRRCGKIPIVIADDHPVLRRGLAQVIESDPVLEVVAEAGDGHAALAEIEALQPKIAVIDADMPKPDGLGTLREIYYNGAPARKRLSRRIQR